MAKRSRASSRNAASRRKPATTRAGSTRRRTAGKRARGTYRNGPPRGLNLKKLRRDLDIAISILSQRLARGPRKVGAAGMDKEVEPAAKLQETVSFMSRWASEIDDICDPHTTDICGDTMIIEDSKLIQ